MVDGKAPQNCINQHQTTLQVTWVKISFSRLSFDQLAVRMADRINITSFTCHTRFVEHYVSKVIVLRLISRTGANVFHYVPSAHKNCSLPSVFLCLAHKIDQTPKRFDQSGEIGYFLCHRRPGYFVMALMCHIRHLLRTDRHSIAVPEESTRSLYQHLCLTLLNDWLTRWL